MNRVVHKLYLPLPGDSITKELPYAFVNRHVALQNGKACLWYEIDTTETKRVEVEIICIGTGWDYHSDFWYLGTVLAEGYVWHYYARFINE